MSGRSIRVALALALATLLLAPAAAHGHAQLLSGSPERGSVLDRAPREVALHFDEPVEAAFGAVRVYDADGERVDDNRLTRPDGSETIATGLRSGLPDGAYTATFRVVSADSHPVSGGFVFTVGQASAQPAASVSDLLADADTGPATDIAFGIARGLGYAAVAVAVGGLAFLVLIAVPAGAAASAFMRRTRATLLIAAAVGALATAAGIVFQGAVAAGTSVWAALDPAVLGDVLGTRFGEASALRLAAWLAFAVLTARTVRPPQARPPRSLGAVALAGFAIAAAVLAVTPGFGGHAGATSPRWLMLPADAMHVAAMAVWLGGLVLMLLALPAATREREPAERTALVARVVDRFSATALLCVALLVATGVVQSIVHLDAVGDLWATAFGRAIALKVVLLGGLVAIAAYNRQRVRPRLRALAVDGAPPGRPGHTLRAAVRAEVALAVAVLGVTAALVSYAPASTSDDMLSESRLIGPVQLELTATPLKPGPQELHLYLLDQQTGAPWDESRDITATLEQREKDIGPLPVELERAGPGHYLATNFMVAIPGDWTLRVGLRVSRFDAYSAEVEVPVR